MKQPEDKLWEILDRSGIDFRQTKAKLIDIFGHRNCGWTTDLDICEIREVLPLIAGLTNSFMFQYQPNENLATPPGTLFSYVRSSSDARKNYSLAVEKLTVLFGVGKDSSVSNTISRSWDFGLASITAVAFPLNLPGNEIENTRHQLIAGSRTECTVSITPAWRTSLKDSNIKKVESYKAIYATPKNQNYKPEICDLSFELDPNTAVPNRGFGFSSDNSILIQFPGERIVNLLPVSWIVALSCHNSLVARGAGGAYLSVTYFAEGKKNGARVTRTIAAIEGEPHSLDKLAEKLKKKLGVPLEITEAMDC